MSQQKTAISSLWIKQYIHLSVDLIFTYNPDRFSDFLMREVLPNTKWS